MVFILDVVFINNLLAFVIYVTSLFYSGHLSLKNIVIVLRFALAEHNFSRTHSFLVGNSLTLILSPWVMVQKTARNIILLNK